MIRASITLLVCGLLASCAGQAGSVQESGFLADYSRLQPGGPDNPLLYYVKPGLDLSRYPNVMIDPVTIRASNEDALNSVPKDDLSYLVKLFYDSAREEIGSVKQIVPSAGPSTMRLRLAITEIVGTSTGNNVVSTIHPIAIITDVGSIMATGTKAFAGRVSIEGALTDSATGEVLAEFVDRRQSDDRFESGEWRQVEDALRFWAAAMRKKVSELSSPTREGSN